MVRQSQSPEINLCCSLELHRFSVLRIRYVNPRSLILIFTHPESRIQKQQQKRGVKKN
jgi:hypothetical protein